MPDALATHLAQLFACRTCTTVAGTPVSGPVRNANILLVGQAPGPREQEERRPFAYTAGKRLFEWFASIGVPEDVFRDNIYIAAVIRCFPGRSPAGGDRAPSREEIANCTPHLHRELSILRPELVIAVGTAAAGEIIGTTTLASIVGVRHRTTLVGHTFDAVVLPHPSGRSTWLNKKENQDRLKLSLHLIEQHPAFASLPKRSCKSPANRTSSVLP